MRTAGERDRLILDNLPLAKYFVGKYFRRLRLERYDRDDVLQAAYLGLIDAAGCYDPTRGDLSTLAARTIKNRLLALDASRTVIRVPGWTLLRRHRGHRHRRAAARARRVELVGDETADLEAAGSREPEPGAGSERADAAAFVRKFLTAAQWRVLREHVMLGRTLEDLAAERGVTKQAVFALYHKALARARSAFAGRKGNPCATRS
jgi:RNA polymerase sigma factor (sigma-70 family)